MHYYDDDLTLFELVRDLFKAASITCVLWALHRSARALILNARVEAYEELEDSYTPEEREILIHRIKTESLRY